MSTGPYAMETTYFTSKNSRSGEGIDQVRHLAAVVFSSLAIATLGGCAVNDDLELADNCAHTPGCVSSKPGSTYGPSHQRAADPVGPAGVPPRR